MPILSRLAHDIKMKLKCKCGKIAVWMYGPGSKDGDGDACDDCVPRGCSCNADLKPGIDYESPAASLPENWVEPLDEKSRRYPCCEWFYNVEGFDDEDTGTAALILQKMYEKSLTSEE